MFCQIINTTPEQDQKIREITTPENLIEWSKGLSNEKRQRIVIDSLQSDIKQLKLISNTFYNQNQEGLFKIDSLNTTIANNTKLHEDILQDQKNLFRKQLRKERLTIGGIGVAAIVLTYLIAK